MKAKKTSKSKGKSKAEKKPRRKLGAYPGKIWIADDFNAPLPEEILSAFEGRLDEGDESQGKR